MQATVVIQIHPSGQRNVCLTNDPTLDPDDLLVQGGGWENASVTKGKVILIGDPEVVDCLLKTELRSVDNVLEILATPPITDQTALVFNQLLREAQ